LCEENKVLKQNFENKNTDFEKDIKNFIIG